MVEVLKFYADWCISPDTLVLTNDGYTKACEIHTNQLLATFDPESKQQSFKKVQRIKFIKEVAYKKLTLETGRSLVGDVNHLILTQEGFKSLGELTREDKILVLPVDSRIVTNHKTKFKTIIDSTSYDFADKTLTNLGMLPLKEDNPKLFILARLVGFLMTDGYLYEDKKNNNYETHFFVGTEEDALNVRKDLELLGFDHLNIQRQAGKRTIGSREVKMSCIKCRSSNRSLFYLLKSLGVPVGRKKNQAYFVPNWIVSGDFHIKKEFMSGWLGGDGCKIEYFVKYGSTTSPDAGFNVNAIEFHKDKELEAEGIVYAKQLGKLLQELGVEINEIKSEDDEDGVIISLRTAVNYNSLLNLTRIGYSYSYTKNLQIPFIREFLAYRLFERNNYTNIKQAVLHHISLGVSNKVVAQSVNTSPNTVATWKRSKTLTAQPSRTGGQARFDEWIASRKDGSLIWEKVYSIEDAEKGDVVGITVEAPHTIITNGIISHNCGPCHALTPIMDELEKELAGKVAIKKIDVDKEGELAAQYGVLSIPTLVIVKEGKETDRIVGLTSKDAIKSKIQPLLS